MKQFVRTSLLVGAGALASAALFLAGRAFAGGPPTSSPVMTYAGVLLDADGAPLSGDQTVEIKLWDSAQPAGTATPLCTSMPKVVRLDTAGRFSVPLDVCVAAVKANANTWVEVVLESGGTATSLGTTKMGAVPYAIEAEHATSADTATTATNAEVAEVSKQIRLDGVEDSDYRFQASSLAGKSDADGNFYVPFIRPFPVQVNTVVAVHANGSDPSVLGLADNYTRNGFTIVMPPNKQTRINWVAVGR
jgi:hypothetical protein